jgi:hypothetical protein
VSLASRGNLLVGVAVAAALLLVGVYLAAGGSSYAPAKTQDPCKERQWRDPGGLQEIAEQFSLSALDGAACRLGVSRERLARALATLASRERFLERQGIDDAELVRAVRAGLLRAIDDAERAGAINAVIAAPLRSALRRIPPEQAIELIQNAEDLLDSLQSFLGPAQGLLEQFFG